MYNHPALVYCLSMYWAVVTLTSIGYGDITPQNEFEYWLSTICMIIMATNWAYVVGSACGILSTLDPEGIQFKQTMDSLNQLMADRDMPHEMRRSLRTYLHESRTVRQRIAEGEIMRLMSPMLQGEVAMYMYKSCLETAGYLKNLATEVLVALAVHMGSMVFAPQEQIHLLKTFFVVQRGIAAKNGRVLTPGSNWGQDMILNDQNLLDRNWTRALSYLEVSTLSRKSLDDCCEGFPSLAVKIRWAVIRLTLMRKLIRAARFLKRNPAFPSGDDAYRLVLITEMMGATPDSQPESTGTIKRQNSAILDDESKLDLILNRLNTISDEVTYLRGRIDDMDHKQGGR
eukprot:gnl/TRDRNA2_/TRDRNA2_153450_c0_seq1.p1 gnl/TRDRNA2_/TRDRNA2_153450_c0~~gnl/TRDRNA2_/TRDRNA2_153450_c0_seq1.p1  ORF type:complete len:343 (-),score=24.35 gnl/TRDRNA2_/TRDRNA2_153450_c0_seq1:86-1114(-)